MTKIKDCIIGYHPDNQDIADKVMEGLRQAGIELQAIQGSHPIEEHSLGMQLAETAVPVVILVSDNFLKSAESMFKVCEAFNKLSGENKIQALVTDGKYRKEGTEEIESIPTSFDRVSDVLKYMNYWQDRYVELRKQKRKFLPGEENTLEKELEITRSISTEVGEFLRKLRETRCYTLEEFSENNFHAFFKFTGHPSHIKPPEAPSEGEKEAEFEEPPLGLSEIPGMDMLAKKGEEEPPGIAPIEIKEERELEERDLQEVSPEDANPEPDFEQEFEELSAIQASLEEETDFHQTSLDSLIDDTSEGEVEELIHPAEDEEKRIILPANFGKEEVVQPTNLDTEAALANAYKLLDSGAIEKGLKVFKNLLDKHPANPSLRYRYAVVLVKYDHNFKEASHELESLLALNPKHVDAWFLLAELAELQNDSLLAKNFYEKVAAHDPNYPGVFYRLGIITLQHFEHKRKTALRYFRKAIKKNKKNVDAHYRIAILLNEFFGKHWKAEKFFKKTLKLDRRHPFANYDLACMYHRLGDKSRASSFYKKAVKVNPELKTPQNEEAFRYDWHSPFDEEASLPEQLKEEEDAEFTQLTQEWEAIQPNQTYAKNSPDERLHQNDISDFESELLEAGELSDEEINPKSTHRHNMENSNQTTTEQNQHSTSRYKDSAPVIFVTGATSGIGKATAEIFAQNGYRLIAAGRRKKRLQALKTGLKKQFGASVRILPFDLRKKKAVKKAVKSLKKKWKKIDILINNAGLAKGFAPIHEGNLEDWDTMIDTNVKGLLYMTRAIAPLMVKKQSGHIINVASSAGKEVYPNGNVYCATKHAVESLTEAMRIDLHKHNIRVSQVSPGHVEETEFALVRFEQDAARAAQVYENFQPLKAKDVAEIIFFIATRPHHVNIQDVFVLGTQQASNIFIDRSGREEEE